MKNTFLITLLVCLCSNLIYAQYAENSVVSRLNFIYIDEVMDGGDEGIGATIEVAMFLNEIEGLSQTVGLEIGYITSEFDEALIEIETDLIPLLINYTIGSDIDQGFVWEAGGGLGVYLVDADSTTQSLLPGGSPTKDSDDDVIFGGQIFGRLGYQFNENLGLMAGVRYMLAEDAKLFDTEDEVLNSVAFDLSLRFAF